MLDGVPQIAVSNGRTPVALLQRTRFSSGPECAEAEGRCFKLISGYLVSAAYSHDGRLYYSKLQAASSSILGTRPSPLVLLSPSTRHMFAPPPLPRFNPILSYSLTASFSHPLYSQSSGPDAFEETLGRLSKKTGVKATIVVDRASGAILKKGGQISSIRTARSASVTDPAPASSVSGGGGGQQQPAGSFSGGEISSVNNGGAGESQGAEELAGLVWNFVNSAGDLVEQLDTEVYKHLKKKLPLSLFLLFLNFSLSSAAPWKRRAFSGYHLLFSFGA